MSLWLTGKTVWRVVCRLTSSELELLESLEYSFARIAFLIFLCLLCLDFLGP